MKRLGQRNYLLISSGAKMLGTFDPEEIFPFFVEELYVNQANEIYDFLRWMHEYNKTFGSANYEQVFREYKRQGGEQV